MDDSITAAKSLRKQTGQFTFRMRSITSGIADLVFPPACLLCETRLDCQSDALLRSVQMCPDCVNGLRSNQPRCGRCDAIVPALLNSDSGCLRCRDEKWLFSRIFSLGVYQNDLRRAVILMKKSTQEPLTLSIGRLLGRYVRDTVALDLRRSQVAIVNQNNRNQENRLPGRRKSKQRESERNHCRGPIDRVLPVPSHWLKVMWRRGSSPDLLAVQVAAELGVPCDRRVLYRRRWTGKQGMLLTGERRKNVENAFALRKSYNLRGLHLLLVDDILTSGATAHEAAKVLRQSGAASVSIAVVARGAGNHGARVKNGSKSAAR